ncbi:MAG: DUF4397 domain-containing protein [Burkholderiales bacterium]|nr:DUF4397 domain-containing protein [Burkholderiales bacterium]
MPTIKFRSLHALAALAALGWLTLLLGGCGGGADRTKAQLRLVDASTGYSALDLVVHGQVRQGGVAYAANAGYVAIDPGNADTTLNSAGSPTALLTFTPALAKNRHYTLLAYGNAGALAQVLLDEDVAAPADGKTLLRVVNGAPDAGNLDVYLTGSGDDLAAAVPVLGGASATPSGWLTVNSATWRLRVTAAGSKTDLRLDLAALLLSSKQVATLVLTPGRGGVLVNALLVTQQGDVTRLDNTQARVRVAAGASGGGAVSASLGGVTLMSGVGSPAVGLYALVPAGPASAALGVNGNSAPVTSLSLAAGGDYTLLVWGPPTAPRAGLIEDDNHLPNDGTQAKVRLLNGLADLGTPLALTVDFVPVADGVAAGTASGYGSVAASITASLSVTAAGLGTPLVGASNQTFVAGANYTVFTLGSAASPVGILRKDR